MHRGHEPVAGETSIVRNSTAHLLQGQRHHRGATTPAQTHSRSVLHAATPLRPIHSPKKTRRPACSIELDALPTIVGACARLQPDQGSFFFSGDGATPVTCRMRKSTIAPIANGRLT